MTQSLLLGTLTYTAILVIHFWYARYVLRNRLFSLTLGLFKTDASILGLLLALNSFSISVFFWPDKTWVWINIGFHLLMAIDEVVRTIKERRRWPFLANHLAFAAVVFEFCFNV